MRAIFLLALVVIGIWAMVYFGPNIITIGGLFLVAFGVGVCGASMGSTYTTDQINRDNLSFLAQKERYKTWKNKD